MCACVYVGGDVQETGALQKFKKIIKVNADKEHVGYGKGLS
jgi:hypothetical protein